MKLNKKLLKIVAVLALLAFLYGFTNERNDRRQIAGVNVEFSESDEMFITYETVNKLLIQNTENTPSIGKEKLVLNKLEAALNANDMIRKAQVYITVNGKLGAKIEQKTPIARVNGDTPFYIDSEGRTMSLSQVFSARVPIVTGVTKTDYADAYTLANYISNDEFLKKQVIAIQRNGKEFELKLRVNDFVVKVGNTDDLDVKFFNFKAFYQKALKDKSLDSYREVNLKFDNQVVCTKK